MIRKAAVTIVPSSVSAVVGYTSDVNGLLRRMQYKTSGCPSSGIKCTIGSEGSSKNQILKFEKLTSGPNEIYPMAQASNAGSTQLALLASSNFSVPLVMAEGRLKICLSAGSSANSLAGIQFSFWYE